MIWVEKRNEILHLIQKWIACKILFTFFWLLQITLHSITLSLQLSCEDELCSIDFSSSCFGCRGVIPFWSSASELVDGFAPLVIILFNQAVWNLGDPPLFELLLGDSGPFLTLFVTLFVTPKRNLYATLLADTISVLACRNCNHQVTIIISATEFLKICQY